MIVAIVAGFIAITALPMMFVATGVGFLCVALLSLVMVIVAFGALMYQHKVAISKSAGSISTERGTLGFLKKETLKLADFQSV